jgi:hypothetical protein
MRPSKRYSFTFTKSPEALEVGKTGDDQQPRKTPKIFEKLDVPGSAGSETSRPSLKKLGRIVLS